MSLDPVLNHLPLDGVTYVSLPFSFTPLLSDREKETENPFEGIPGRAGPRGNVTPSEQCYFLTIGASHCRKKTASGIHVS